MSASIPWPKIRSAIEERPRLPTTRIEQSVETMTAYYQAMIEWQKQENLRNYKMIGSLRALVERYYNESESLQASRGVRRTAYEVLMDIANDPTKDDVVRIKAASEAAQYDRPKLTASINRNENVLNIGDELDRARDRITLISGPNLT